MFIKYFAVGIFLMASQLARSSPATPLGQWRTLSDKTHRVESVVEIFQVGNEYRGKIIQLFPLPNEKPNPVCEKCSGELKNRPVLGLQFLWGFLIHEAHWSKGKVLDPNEGKVYQCSIKISPDGNKLIIRGYVGLPLFGRSQTWERVIQSSIAQ